MVPNPDKGRTIEEFCSKRNETGKKKEVDKN